MNRVRQKLQLCGSRYWTGRGNLGTQTFHLLPLKPVETLSIGSAGCGSWWWFASGRFPVDIRGKGRCGHPHLVLKSCRVNCCSFKWWKVPEPGIITHAPFLIQNNSQIRVMWHYLAACEEKVELFMKLTKRFEDQKGTQQSIALVFCTVWAIQPHLVMSPSFFHLLLDPKISLGKGGIFMRKYDESCRSHHDLLDFFSKINLCFLKEERKIAKHVLLLIQMYFHLNILNENSFPSVGIHPGATFPQNMCLHIQNLSLKKTTFSFPNQGIFLIIKELAGLQKQK